MFIQQKSSLTIVVIFIFSIISILGCSTADNRKPNESHSAISQNEKQFKSTQEEIEQKIGVIIDELKKNEVSSPANDEVMNNKAEELIKLIESLEYGISLDSIQVLLNKYIEYIQVIGPIVIEGKEYNFNSLVALMTMRDRLMEITIFQCNDFMNKAQNTKKRAMQDRYAMVSLNLMGIAGKLKVSPNEELHTETIKGIRKDIHSNPKDRIAAWKYIGKDPFPKPYFEQKVIDFFEEVLNSEDNEDVKLTAEIVLQNLKTAKKNDSQE